MIANCLCLALTRAEADASLATQKHELLRISSQADVSTMYYLMTSLVLTYLSFPSSYVVFFFVFIAASRLQTGQKEMRCQAPLQFGHVKGYGR
jgi:integral membrane sensor domain MASE1